MRSKKSFLYFMVIAAMCILLPGYGYSHEGGKELTGVFYQVEGLKYETQTGSGMTDKGGEFEYRPGEIVTFSIGKLVLGSAPGSKLMTEAHLVPAVSGDVTKIKNQIVTNMARFVQSLDKGSNVENGITISHHTAEVVTKYKNAINFNQSEAAFTADPNVVALFAELDLTLRTPAQGRNLLRRTLYGIHKTTDVKIPTGGRSYVLGDVYRPIWDGKYPPLLNLGPYGKTFYHGCICNQADLQTAETNEHNYFENGRTQFGVPFENHETPNTVDWVPKGYVVVRIDGAGYCNSPYDPGTTRRDVFSYREAQNLYDAIEWAAVQPWSNGNVGLWGISYYAMNQFNVAQLQPPSLKAMIPISGDINSYRDYNWEGGIYTELFLNWWWYSLSRGFHCGTITDPNPFDASKSHPFDDPAIYGPTGSLSISPDMGKVTVPFIDITGVGGVEIHARGGHEAYILSASEDKKLIQSIDMIGDAYGPDGVSEQMAFFDYWLKGIDNGVMDEPPVKVAIRTGNGQYFQRYEEDWPIHRTQYTRYYLDASPSTWVGDGKRDDFMILSKTVPTGEMSRTYSSEVSVGSIWPPVPPPNPTPCWATGVSFVTEPLENDMEIAGSIKLVTWVSSTTSDMDTYASVRVMDENKKEVDYAGTGAGQAAATGLLKVSHRKLDLQKSTIYRPYHTHLEADYAPLTSSNPVEAQVEIFTTTALIKKGWRIRLDVQPYEGCGNPMKRAYDATYHDGGFNTIYTGPKHRSYLQLPVIPPKHDEHHGHHGHDRD
jgi:predicted acyl esterase